MNFYQRVVLQNAYKDSQTEAVLPKTEHITNNGTINYVISLTTLTFITKMGTKVPKLFSMAILYV